MGKFAGIMILMILVGGCATGRNYQPEIDSLASKVDALENQIQAKSLELGSLKDKNRFLEQQMESLKQAKRDAEIRLDACLGKLANRKAVQSTSGYDKQSDSYVK